jgi:hypothetical protein
LAPCFVLSNAATGPHHWVCSLTVVNDEGTQRKLVDGAIGVAFRLHEEGNFPSEIFLLGQGVVVSPSLGNHQV